MQAPEIEEKEEETVTKRRRRRRGLYSGRNKNLPRVIIPIDPEGDLSRLEKIGEEVHSVFHFQPARFMILQYVRNKYVDPNNKEAGVLMGTLPENVKGKRSATIETLSEVEINKYVDHPPTGGSYTQTVLALGCRSAQLHLEQFLCTCCQ